MCQTFQHHSVRKERRQEIWWWGWGVAVNQRQMKLQLLSRVLSPAPGKVYQLIPPRSVFVPPGHKHFSRDRTEVEGPEGTRKRETLLQWRSRECTALWPSALWMTSTAVICELGGRSVSCSVPSLLSDTVTSSFKKPRLPLKLIPFLRT